MVSRAVTCLIWSFVAASAFAQAPVKPGEYILDGGSGNLTLKPGKNGALLFSIETIGANAHTCSLEGELREGKASLDGNESGKPCIVTIRAVAEGIAVKSSDDGECRYYCGARASFDGTYLQPPTGCSGNAIAATRKSFKQLYDRKQFADARAKLEPVMKDCARQLDWLETGRIRNDLAVTLHKLGDLVGCRAILKPLAENAAATDAALRENYPPTDAENYLPIARATRTNLKLCRE
ncbi:MAG: hypothetical protein ABL931_05410 [Usitatibacteraceae bacterium]